MANVGPTRIWRRDGVGSSGLSWARPISVDTGRATRAPRRARDKAFRFIRYYLRIKMMVSSIVDLSFACRVEISSPYPWEASPKTGGTSKCHTSRKYEVRLHRHSLFFAGRPGDRPVIDRVPRESSR